MKKAIKALALGLCLTVGACAAVACGGNNDDNKPGTKDPFATASDNWETPDEAYWLAGDYKYYGYSWDEPKDGRVQAGLLFEQNKDNENLWRQTFTLYGKDDNYNGDKFKVRFEGMGWDEGEVDGHYSKLSWDTHLNEAQRDAEDAAFIDGGGMGGQDFGVAKSGLYEIRIDCSGDSPVVSYVRKGDAPVLVEGITLDKPSAIVAMGTTVTLTPEITPADAADKTVTWESSDKTVVTVANGVVTPVKEGSATVTATASGKTASCVVYVVAEGTTIVEPTEVKLDKTELSLHAGDTATLTATKAPDNATGNVVYTSSAPSIVEVDISTGAVTAKAAGTATITASLLGKTATCTVTVAKDYYIAGKGAFANTEETEWKQWDKFTDILAGTLFTVDEEKGGYSIKDITINRGDQFQILTLGKGWDDSLALEDIEQEEGKECFGAAGKNIVCLDSAKYNIYISKQGKVTYEIPKGGDIEDVKYESIKVEVWGDGVPNWANAYEGKTVTANAANNFKVEVTLDLAANEQFQFRTYNGASTSVAVYYGKVDNVDDVDGLSNGSNIVCGTAGTYKFTIQLNEYGEVVSVTAAKA